MLIRCAVAVLTAGSLVACGSPGPKTPSADRVDVVAAIYPLQFVAERVGGDGAQVSLLTRPGTEPHDLELTVRQVAELSEANLVVHLGGLQPAVDKAVAQEAADRSFDVATVQPLLDAAEAGHTHEDEEHEGETHAEEGEEHADEGPAAESGGAKDPHVWLDPTRLATIGDRLAERLGAIDPARAADFTARAAQLRADLTELDKQYATALRDCDRREIITSHAAFGYLTARYDLEQIGITGLSPESEPSPQRLVEVAAEAREHRATTIFFETLVDPKVAETIASQVGAKTAVLDPLEGLRPGVQDDYFTVMRANLAALTDALGCR